MNILLSAYACEPHRGSEEGFGWNWSTHLAKEGHEVWVVTRTWARETVEKEMRENPIPNLRFIFVDIPARYKPAMKGIFGVYAHYFLWQRAAYRQAKELLNEHKFDLAHHVTWGSLIGGSWLWKLNIPFIFGPVGGGQVAPEAFKEYFPTRWRQESIRTYITEKFLPSLPATKRMLKHTALLLATNSDTLNIAKTMGAIRSELFLDTGLPDHYFADAPKAGFSNEKMNILWVGRLLERKAIKFSLEVVAKLNFPFQMTILGDGPEDAFVNDWINELGLSGKVEWKGRVPWDEVQTAYEEHEVFLFTSLRDSFGSQLLEAMSNGLAIVTLDHQGAHDFVPNEAGIRVKVSNPKETMNRLAEALTSLHENPEKLSGMSKTGLEFARRNNWTIKAAEMTKMYDSVVKNLPEKALY
ncbi:MAG: glycosyltransferase family 4 protein [Rhodothermales bacterium]